MFCPNCGRDNTFGIKFCASCGTNLEVIFKALSVREEGLFTKLDTSLDQFIARYAEHVFKDAPARAMDRKLSKSWQVLGQGTLTTLFDLAMFSIMSTVLPIKLLILMIYTPIKLVSDRSKDSRGSLTEGEGYKAGDLFDSVPSQWLSDSVGSVTDNTTVNLGNSRGSRRSTRLKTDPLDHRQA